jgi:mitochondrial-processing peptidase subunit alpha
LFLQLQKIKSEIAEVSSNPQGLLLEALHSAGYSGALAKPLMASESAVNRLDVSVLEEFVAVRVNDLFLKFMFSHEALL